jgi:L-fucose isomerase-like protein
MKNNKSTFAVFIGSRSTFPAKLIAESRIEIKEALNKLGHEILMLDADATANGAVESIAEGRIFADFLKQHEGKFDGIILTLPNFGNEGSAVIAVKDANVPILVHAYPDELDKMMTATRRDAFCGKFAIMNILHQHGVKFTALEPHAVHPQDTVFAENIDYFDRLCRVTNGMKNFTIGAVGARTTSFKAVRYDELALQKHGINIETLDLSNIFRKIGRLDDKSSEVIAKKETLLRYTRWDGVPEHAITKISKLGVVLDEIVEDYDLDAMALRCWIELQEYLGVSPCVLVSEMNERGITVACEVDVCSAVVMRALKLAGDGIVTNLDWNNNYGAEKDKCILFHCGAVPRSMMQDYGKVVDHDLLVPTLGTGCSWGCNVGRIRPMPFTFGGLQTINGKLECYLGEGYFTENNLPDNFFGAAGVAQITNLQAGLKVLGLAGHRHHTNVTEGHFVEAVKEAFESYLGYNVVMI